MQALVIFYSRGGTTRQLAHAIADQLQCNSEEITEPKSRKGFIGYMRSGYEATRKKTSLINPVSSNLQDADVVLVGTPVWGAKLSSPVRTFLTQYGKSLNNVAFFCTKGGSDTRKLFGDMEQLCNKAPLAILDLRQGEVKNQQYASKLEEFLSKIQEQ